MLARLCRDDETAIESLYDGLMPASFVVLNSLLRCFDPRHPPREADMKALAHAVWGVQGGLDQIFLVDENARWIAGELVEYLGGHADLYGLKFTGGASGGYLVCVGPSGLSRAMMDSFVARARAQPGSAGRDITLDYVSTTEPPDGQGLLVSFPDASRNAAPVRPWCASKLQMEPGQRTIKRVAASRNGNGRESAEQA